MQININKIEAFERATPESVGVSSDKVLDFIRTLDECKMHTHSIIMARGEKIFAECYYKPFDEKFLHRMYSVSKSFVAVAVGLAITEGLIGYDDIITDYFPEFKNENIDEHYEKCTVRDMLMMRSNIAGSVNWWGKFTSRVEAYYSQKTKKISGTLYTYDSIGSFLLGCIIEKLTGKTFLEYLKEKVLLKMGFSEESYVLREPGGYAIGDSGVMCTSRDLLILSRLIMRGGEWGGIQYIDREFMENAIKKQVSNHHTGSFDSYNTRGYGYLIWKTHEDGFSLVGMGDQLAICDTVRDFVFIITSDNQAETAARHVLYHELYKHFLPQILNTTLPENHASYKKLEEYLSKRELVTQSGNRTSEFESKVFGAKYIAMDNALGISDFEISTNDGEGELKFTKSGKPLSLKFGICKNKLTAFSFGERAKSDMMGIYIEGSYDCAVSAAWTEEHTFAIMAQVIDTYFGCLNINICFKDDGATLRMTRSGQYVFTGIEGFIIAKKENRK